MTDTNQKKLTARAFVFVVLAIVATLGLSMTAGYINAHLARNQPHPATP